MSYEQILGQRPFVQGGIQANPYAQMFSSLVGDIAGFRQEHGGNAGGGSPMFSASLPHQPIAQGAAQQAAPQTDPYLSLGFSGGGNSQFQRRKAPVSTVTESYYG